jgi:chlorobactene lauroyltransferase
MGGEPVATRARAVPRLPSQKNPALAALIYNGLARPAMRRAFHRVALAAPYGEEWWGLSTIFYASHVSWWDGYMAFLLCNERWHIDGYLMMEEPQLRRYHFFQRCGCFSVDRHDPREAMRAVIYGARLLGERPGRALWIFPQGTIQPPDRRPLLTYAGAAHLARRAAPVRCVPVALRFEFGGEQRPEALIRLGEPHLVEQVDTRSLHAEMDRRLLGVVEQLREDVVNGTTRDYQTILAGHRSINVWWDHVRGKL